MPTRPFQVENRFRHKTSVTRFGENFCQVGKTLKVFGYTYEGRLSTWQKNETACAIGQFFII